MSLPAGNSNRMASVLKSLPCRLDVGICGLVQHREWHGHLADLAPPWEPAVAVAIISYAFGGRTRCDRDLHAFPKCETRYTVCANTGLFGLGGSRQGTTSSLYAAWCPFSLGGSGLNTKS